MLIGYARVSSEGDRQSADLQLDALKAAGVDPRNVYLDRCSGAAHDRPGLRRVLDYLAAGDVLVVWKLDRLGRSLPHLLEILAGLKAAGVGFRSLTEGMDTTTPGGELLFQLFGALAQYEHSLSRERIMAGLDSARSRGRTGGRPRAISDETLEAIAQNIEGGMTVACACRVFGVPRQTLVDALKRRNGVSDTR